MKTRKLFSLIQLVHFLNIFCCLISLGEVIFSSCNGCNLLFYWIVMEWIHGITNIEYSFSRKCFFYINQHKMFFCSKPWKIFSGKIFFINENGEQKYIFGGIFASFVVCNHMHDLWLYYTHTLLHVISLDFYCRN